MPPSLSNTRERSICLSNLENLGESFRPWTTIADAQFHPEVRALYTNANINPAQSIQTDYFPSLISYLWPLVHRGDHIWAVDHPTRESTPIKFVLKYDLLVWDVLHRSNIIHQAPASAIVYPFVLILAPDWLTCENIYTHLNNVNTTVLKKLTMCCIYEGQNVEEELYKKFLTHGCDLLIATPSIVDDLIQRRHVHFEKLQMIVYDQLDLLLQFGIHIREIMTLIGLSSNPIQHLLWSRCVNLQTMDFIHEYIHSKVNYHYLSSSMMETFIYCDFFIYCEPCRNWLERKRIVKETLDFAQRCGKKLVMCAYQTRRLGTMQSILNDLAIQSVLIHPQLNQDQIQQHIDDWRTIVDRPLVLLIQDEILNEINIDDADIVIHLDVQRLIWYQLFHQRLKLMYKHVNKSLFIDRMVPSLTKLDLSSLAKLEQYFLTNASSTIPLSVILWPGDCAQVTYDLIEYLHNSNAYIHPLIERLADNNCFESNYAKINVEFCPTLKMFGECLTQKKFKRCPYRHRFNLDVDQVEQQPQQQEKFLSDTYELYMPKMGEVEISVTHVTDGNRLWARILRARNDANESLNKLFDYEQFDQQVQTSFEQVKMTPLCEIVPGEIYFYCNSDGQARRVYVHDQEQMYFDVRRADAVLNRLLKYQTNEHRQTPSESQPTIMIDQKKSAMITNDRLTLTVFALDTGVTYTLKSNEYLYPIESSSLKQYPPLATEIILCQIRPLDKITMTFTPFTIETLRSLTLNQIFMGRIKLATRSCLWIDPLVKPVRLASLKRIVYDKPIRKQLMLAKLVDFNEQHMVVLERLAAEIKLNESTLEVPSMVVETTTTTTTEEESVKPPPPPPEETPPVFQPFLNRIGQLIINPVGRSKQFFSRHNNQQLYSEFVVGSKSISPTLPLSEKETTQPMLPPTETKKSADHYLSVGRGQRVVNTRIISDSSSSPENILNRPPSESIPAGFHHSEEYSAFRSLAPVQQISTVTTPSEIEPSKTITQKEEDEDEIFEDTIDSLPSVPVNVASSQSVVEPIVADDDDQMTFVFGPKMFAQLRQIKEMEDEQRRQADFPVQRNRGRRTRGGGGSFYPETKTNENENGQSNETFAPNMSRFEPFVGERGPLTQEQQDFRRTQRKTRLFWEQTAKEIYLNIGFYNVDSTQTRVEFQSTQIYCRTKIRMYDRFVRIHLSHEIVPEKSRYQVRIRNILVTMRKANEGLMWTTLTDRALEPRPDFFAIEYGSDDESDTEKRRRTVGQQWQNIRDDVRKTKVNNDEEKYLIDDFDEDEPATTTSKVVENETEQHEQTDTSSDCHSTDSDDCYYEDQVPANHVPKGYDEADYDHRFYGQQLRP